MPRPSLPLLVALTLAAGAVEAGPPDGGLVVRADGAGSFVTDTIGGYRVRLPGTPTISSGDVDTPVGTRPQITAESSIGDGAVTLVVIRFERGDIDSAKVTRLAYDALEKRMRTHISDFQHSDLALLGLPARHYGGRFHFAEGITPRIDAWLLYAPAHATMYELIVYYPSSGDASLGKIIGTLRAARSR